MNKSFEQLFSMGEKEMASKQRKGSQGISHQGISNPNANEAVLSPGRP